METIRLEATATMEDVIVAFNKLSESYANEVAILQQRLDAAGRVCKDLQRKLRELTGPSSTAEDIQNKVLVREDTQKTIDHILNTLRSFDTSIDQKIEACDMAETLISNEMGSEKQRETLKSFVTNFWTRHPKVKKNRKKQDTPSNDAKEDDIQTSGNKELDDAYNTLVHCLNKCCNLDDKHLRFTDEYKETAIKAVDTHFKIQELLKNGARLPKKQFAYFAQCTAKENGWWKTMMETWTENNDNKTMDGNDGGGEEAAA